MGAEAIGLGFNERGTKASAGTINSGSGYFVNRKQIVSIDDDAVESISGCAFG